MNTNTPNARVLRNLFIARIALAALVLAPGAAQADTAPALLDDFSHAELNAYGHPRLLIDDEGIGSRSQATQSCSDGVLSVSGELVPGRGVPAFISLASLLSEDGQPVDLSSYLGVRLRVKLLKGSVAVQVASAEIDNYDYHSSAPIAIKRGEFQDLRLPFAAMRRAWSEQTPLGLKAVTSINLVVFGMAKDSFAYEVEEIGFY